MPRSGQRLTPVKEGFHATVHTIKGDEILPSSKHGNSIFPNYSSPDDSYFTPIHETEASNELAQHQRGDDYPKEPMGRAQAEDNSWEWAHMIRGSSMGGPARARVHLTEPDEEQYADRNGSFLGARVAPKQRIKDTLWGPRPKEGESVEMTLPHVNWSQLRPDKLYADSDPPVDQSRLQLGTRPSDNPLPNYITHQITPHEVIHREDNGYRATTSPREGAWRRGESDAQSKVDYDMSKGSRLMSMPDTVGVQQRLWYGNGASQRRWNQP